jgi:hypothetical protein
MANLAEPRSLRIRETQAPLQLRLQDPILRNQILIPQQQFLIHGPDDVRQDARPLQNIPPAP